jgi:hypothetical protein
MLLSIRQALLPFIRPRRAKQSAWPVLSARWSICALALDGGVPPPARGRGPFPVGVRFASGRVQGYRGHQLTDARLCHSELLPRVCDQGRCRASRPYYSSKSAFGVFSGIPNIAKLVGDHRSGFACGRRPSRGAFAQTRRLRAAIARIRC